MFKGKIPVHDSVLENDPEQAFRMLVHRCNGKNQKDLLLFSSFLSLFDYFDTFDYNYNVFAPIINVEMLGLLSQAIIRSKSNNYKSNPIIEDDLNYFYIRWLNVMGFRKKEIIKQNYSEESKSQQALAMSNIQLRFQNYGLTQRGIRSFIQFSEISNQYKDEIHQNLKDSYVSISDEFQKAYNISISEFIFFGEFLLFMCKNFFRLIYPKEYSQEKRKEIQQIDPEPLNSGSFFNEDKRKGLFHIYSVVKNDLEAIVIKPDFFVNTPFNDSFEKYIPLISRTSYQIKELLQTNPAYQEGIILDSLCPLERFPLIKINETDNIIPNFRFLAYAITDSIHYMLQNIFSDNRYNQTLGKIQEIYIRQLLNSSYLSETLLPEIEYKKGKQSVKSPDFTLLGDRIIIIESKAKRPSAQLKSNPGSKLFLHEMENIEDAFCKAPTKITDIISEIDSFSNWHKEIECAKKGKPAVVVVTGEGFEIPMQILSHHIKFNNFANLQAFPFDFALINLSILERIVSISANKKIPISKIFESILADSTNYESTKDVFYFLQKEYKESSVLDSPYIKEEKEKFAFCLKQIAEQLEKTGHSDLLDITE